MKKQVSAWLLLFAVACMGWLPAKAQQKYWVFLTDKKGSDLNPYTYFDAKALERRVRQNLPLYDETDLPLNAAYVATVTGMVDSVRWESRWFNAVSCYAKPQQIAALQKLPFVREVMPIKSMVALAAFSAEPDTETLDETQKKLLQEQVASLGIADFQAKNLDGSGMRVAVLDAGFTAADVAPALEHLYKQNRILQTYDFVKKKPFVYSFSSHGTQVLSCIAGMYKGQQVGLATGAEFLLARTEKHLSEPFSEEENWLAAVEWADKNGADIINSSLAYTYHRYFQEQMNGKTSLVARAANLAAKKGILVVNSAGNDGSNSWKKIGTPADADSVLTVGGIDENTRYRISFSSYGPTADKRMKPNVVAFGHVMAASPGGLASTSGTSFSSPLVAGFAACAWQQNRSLTNMQLFREIEKSGNLYPYFDYAHGFGVPQAAYFTKTAPDSIAPSFSFVDNGVTLEVLVPDATPQAEPVAQLEGTDQPAVQTTASDDKPEAFLYYHIQNSKGQLDKYYVVKVNKPQVLILNKEEIGTGKTIRVSYKHYTQEYKIQ